MFVDVHIWGKLNRLIYDYDCSRLYNIVKLSDLMFIGFAMRELFLPVFCWHSQSYTALTVGRKLSIGPFVDVAFFYQLLEIIFFWNLYQSV